MSQKAAKLMRELYELDLSIRRAEDSLNHLKSRRHMLSSVDLPEAMTEMGSSYTELDDGSSLVCSVDFRVRGSLPNRDNPDARNAAIEYLKSVDAAGLIKASVLITYDKGDVFAASRMKNRLLEMTNRLVTVDCDVHHSSLAAWARERIKQNKPLNMDIVGLQGFTIASVKKVEK